MSDSVVLRQARTHLVFKRAINQTVVGYGRSTGSSKYTGTSHETAYVGIVCVVCQHMAGQRQAGRTRID